MISSFFLFPFLFFGLNKNHQKPWWSGVGKIIEVNDPLGFGKRLLYNQHIPTQ